MKKLILSVCTAFCIMAAPLAAVEWGGLFSNETGVTTPDFSAITINQSNALSLWVKSPLGSGTGLYFSSEALYKYKLSIPVGEKIEFTHFVDVPLLKISGDLNLGAGVLSLNAGRFFYVDSSSAIISQIVDGASISFALPVVKVGGFVGYTGLLNSLNTSSVTMAVSSTKENNVYRLAYPYLPLGLTIEFPSLAGNQSIEIDGYFLADVGAGTEKEGDPSVKEKSNLFYANLIASGPIANSVYYNAGTTIGMQNFKNLMNYSSVSFLVFPSEAVSFNAGVSFGSAEQGPFKLYKSLAPVSITAAGKIVPKTGFSYTVGNMYLGLNGDVMLAYADKKYTPSTTDWNVEFFYNIFTDLQVGLTVSTTIDLTAAKANNYDAKLNLALAF